MITRNLPLNQPMVESSNKVRSTQDLATTSPSPSVPDETDSKSPWKKSLAGAYHDPQELLADLGIEADLVVLDPAPTFPFRVPREFAEKMRHGDLDDPLLRQVLPFAQELSSSEGFLADPVEDSTFETQPGLLHKYLNRALIITTGGCAINCRYCFRRNFPYQNSVGNTRFQKIIETLQQSTDIEEIILSGGDPLLLDDEKLAGLCAELDAISHLKRLRIHTRLPVTIPSRITPALQKTLGETRLEVAFVIHANHPNEVDTTLAQGLKSLHKCGVNLFNQSVLLRGVNDAPSSLVRLSERLFSANVTPYYVHLLDPVSGSAHFAVSLERAKEIEQSMRDVLPGYLLPKFVREIPHQTSKTPIHLL